MRDNRYPRSDDSSSALVYQLTLLPTFTTPVTPRCRLFRLPPTSLRRRYDKIIMSIFDVTCHATFAATTSRPRHRRRYRLCRRRHDVIFTIYHDYPDVTGFVNQHHLHYADVTMVTLITLPDAATSH